MSAYQDQECQCIDCPNKFIFTAGEQEFFATKGFTPPKRCKPCRDKKKAEKEARGGGGGGGYHAGGGYSTPEPAPSFDDRGGRGGRGKKGRRGNDRWDG